MEANVLICPACGRENRVEEGTCECGYDEALEQGVVRYAPQNALTATLDVVQGEAGPKFEANTGLPWTLDVDDVKAFLAQIERKFKLKRKNHSFISKNVLPLSTATLLGKYNKGTITFPKFVESFMGNLKNEAALSKTRPAGGAVIFIHYHKDNEEDSLGRVFVIMVNNNSVFNFDDDLVPRKLPSIDIDALRQAALIDLTLFDTLYPETNGEPYVQFITGKSSSNFFKVALGCTEELDNNKSIEEVKRALLDFSGHMNLSPIIKVRLLQDFSQLMVEKNKSTTNKTITLKELEHIVDKVLPEASKAKGKFEQFALLGEYKINEHFEPSRVSQKQFEKVTLKDTENEYSCNISVGVISEDVNSESKVIYNKEEGKLIIRLSESDIKSMNDVFGSK
ncbi:nucleoid-associated protein [Klebsiella quasipneumoniae]|uniref:nucleoid-associated protein n=1 Tax=Klebsiella quasipneumoniae TaxID=1463165 RepID=UPI003D321B59